MSVIIGSVIGFLSSTLPDVLKIFQDGRDKKHEINILKLQMEASKGEHRNRLEEINSHADIAESRALYKTYTTGINWVDALNGTVRPVLAYSFFLMYCVVKLCLISSYLGLDGATLEEAVVSVWGSADQTIFAAIIAFYYGKRSIDRVMGRK